MGETERHLKQLALFFVAIIIAFLRLEWGKKQDPDDLGKGRLVLTVEGVPHVEANRLKVRVRVLSGDFSKTYGKTGYLTLFGAEGMPSESFEVLGKVKLNNGRVFIYASYKDIKSLVFTRKSVRELFMQRVEERVKDQEVKGLVFSYLFGESQDILPFEYQASFLSTGLLHLLVVSGAHLTLIAIILRFLLPGVYGLLLSLVGVSLYTFFIVPPDPPVLRAYIMILMALLIKLSYHRPDYLSLLLFSACVLLFLFPEYLYSYSFWLSFVATLYIVLALRHTDKIKEAISSENLYRVFMSFWTSFFAFFGTCSIVATFSLMTPLSILFTPLLSFPFLLFTAYGVLELLTFFSLPSFPLELLGKLILKLVSLFSFAGFTLNVPISVFQAVFLSAVGGLLLYFLKDWWKLLAVLPTVLFLLPLLL